MQIVEEQPTLVSYTVDRADFEIIFVDVDDVTYNVRMEELMAKSDYFKACLLAPMVESQEHRMEIEDDPILFGSLIRSVYTNQIHILLADVIPMINLCVKYSLTEQEKALEEFLKANLSPTNVLHCWHLDTEREEHGDLFNHVITYINANMNKIADGPPIPYLSIEQFTDMLTMLRLSDHLTTTKLIVKWIEGDTDRYEQLDYLVEVGNFVNSRCVLDKYYIKDRGNAVCEIGSSILWAIR
jgi:hypothetical protein